MSHVVGNPHCGASVYCYRLLLERGDLAINVIKCHLHALRKVVNCKIKFCNKTDSYNTQFSLISKTMHSCYL